MHGNEDINNSLMLSFHDLRSFPLRRLPFTVPYGVILGSVTRRQTCLNHNSLRRLTVDSKAVDDVIRLAHLNFSYKVLGLNNAFMCPVLCPRTVCRRGQVV